ncbi:alcohol dehydrogenase catalytic domain-containing protein [Pelagibacterales bacterium SAG-MED31]|nr:alcohol dehydrogenase catalytic domain-containing protein [Pelagibacterales bacterium SAG-MED31]
MQNRIVRFSEFGGPEVLKISNEEIKEPKKNEIRIKVKALGLNQAEVMLREGRYVGKPELPSRIGIEASGIVESIGDGVTKFKVGDEVCAIPFLSWDDNDFWTNESINSYGTYGDTAIIPEWTVTEKISHQSFEEAAAAWCQYLTAWGGLIYNANIEQRKCCLITGASSSAAIGAMQIVKIFGLKTIAVSRTLKKAKELKSIGYDEVLALEDDNFEENVLDVTNGSIIRNDEGKIKVGPDSVGYKLDKESLIFGGKITTTSDIAVAAGDANFGDNNLVSHLDKKIITNSKIEIKKLIEDGIDRVKLNKDDVPVILVGGGSILVKGNLKGASEVLIPEHSDVANAIGASLAQAGGEIDKIYSYSEMGRDQSIENAKKDAIERALQAGAIKDSINIIELEEIPLSYLPSGSVRIHAKAVGDIF